MKIEIKLKNLSFLQNKEVFATVTAIENQLNEITRIVSDALYEKRVDDAENGIEYQWVPAGSMVYQLTSTEIYKIVDDFDGTETLFYEIFGEKDYYSYRSLYKYKELYKLNASTNGEAVVYFDGADDTIIINRLIKWFDNEQATSRLGAIFNCLCNITKENIIKRINNTTFGLPNSLLKRKTVWQRIKVWGGERF